MSLRVLLPLCLVACALPPRDAVADRAAVEAVLRAYETAYNARDANALAALHAPDGGYYVPSGDPVIGHAALAAFWARSGGTGLSLTLEAHAVDGQIGWAAGRWQIGDTAHGRFALGLRRGTSGRFSIVVDLNNEARRG